MNVTRATDGHDRSHLCQSPGDADDRGKSARPSVGVAGQYCKIAVCGCSKQTTTCGELPKVINTDHHQKPACAGCIGLRSRPRPLAVVEHSKSRRPQLPRVGAVASGADSKKLAWCCAPPVGAETGLR